jgi:hypothetical protein
MVNISSHLIESKRMISAGILLVRSKSITSIDASLQRLFQLRNRRAESLHYQSSKRKGMARAPSAAEQLVVQAPGSLKGPGTVSIGSQTRPPKPG